MKRLTQNKKYQTGRIIASWVIVLLLICAALNI